LPEEIARLKEIMEKQPSPDRKSVQEQTARAIKKLDEWATSMSDSHYSSKDLAAILQHIADRGSKEKAGSWDEATKTYLAVVAIHQAWRDSKGAHAAPPEVNDALRKIRTLLQSTSGGDSPQGRYTPDLLLEPFGLLKKRLGS
ncbi:MAG TPA: hypothetical protein VE988_20255, partial [Gemmataceae bacterium]|nr:hypothetical protein [Gemmataceae bacterium]